MLVLAALDSPLLPRHILSRGINCKASYNNPGFSYFVGISDNEINRFRDFCDCASTAGEGILGKFRSDAYDGKLNGGGLREEDADARRLDDEARSRGDREPARDRDRSSSFSLFVRNNPANCTCKPFAHCSSYSKFCDSNSSREVLRDDGEISTRGGVLYLARRPLKEAEN